MSISPLPLLPAPDSVLGTAGLLPVHDAFQYVSHVSPGRLLSEWVLRVLVVSSVSEEVGEMMEEERGSGDVCVGGRGLGGVTYERTAVRDRLEELN